MGFISWAYLKFNQKVFGYVHVCTSIASVYLKTGHVLLLCWWLLSWPSLLSQLNTILFSMHKSINAINYVNWLKDKNKIIISRNAKKFFWKKSTCPWWGNSANHIWLGWGHLEPGRKTGVDRCTCSLCCVRRTILDFGPLTVSISLPLFNY